MLHFMAYDGSVDKAGGKQEEAKLQSSSTLNNDVLQGAAES